MGDNMWKSYLTSWRMHRSMYGPEYVVNPTD